MRIHPRRCRSAAIARHAVAMQTVDAITRAAVAQSLIIKLQRLLEVVVDAADGGLSRGPKKFLQLFFQLGNLLLLVITGRLGIQNVFSTIILVKAPQDG